MTGARSTRRSASKPAWLFAGIGALGFFAFGGSSRAATGPSLDAVVVWSASGVPHISVSAAPLADEALRARLASGQPTTLVVRITAYADDEPIASRAHGCHAIYDAWQRRFEVRIDGHVTIVPDLDAALARCLDVHDVSLGAPADWRGHSPERAELAIAVDVNPITRSTARSLSTWLARSGGGTGEPTFFGRLVSRLVFERGDVERTLGTHPLRTGPGGAAP